MAARRFCTPPGPTASIVNVKLSFVAVTTVRPVLLHR